MSLTIKEKEVLKLIMNGKSSAGIGAVMGITERTVKFHVSNIMEKLDAENRTHAVAIAIEKGMI